ncbi:hypothetical protein [Pseudomonas vancouverensis]|uniref:Uncharacterized protein n=1 Tax=Pseudomonas vancouverensis TaxID=95300 RepID=A0A1H2PJV1_PSEVA|nr:hypothetical protein [Pseudomonas vancouverensis]KAB0492576.1 hypothetical protein F7R09_23265 [Pseudomonas vancouverensis]TDB58474.1 hypothetical protein EIY72_23305 [Pseudomonas vancouverensis]SDV17276.1 hypothetical protein SAMN05216558_5908 [Pseudomonas vancouverensis]
MRSFKWRFAGYGAWVIVHWCAPAYALVPPNFPPMSRDHCLVAGNWYGFYRDKMGLSPICIKLPDTISVKMLDSNADGVVDDIDAISSEVKFVGENPSQDNTDNDGNGIGEDSAGDIPPAPENSGGSRRIMWRQIQ